MSLEVVYGEARNRAIALQLAVELENAVSEGTVYLGYPVLSSADESVYVDALLVSAEHGLVAFQLADGVPTTDDDWERFVSDQDRLFGALESHLGRHDELRARRRLAFEIQTVTVFASDPGKPAVDVNGGHYCDIESVTELVRGFEALDDDLEHALQAAIQRVSTIKPVKRRGKVTRSDSRGAILKEIERGIANLDRWQKRAAIETPDGPQRIRGLAGSGKTVVLALKAAYLHAQQPEWRIVLTFQSRALYQQLEDLVTRFSFEHSNDRPDFDRLQILHAWGSSAREGVYNTIARHIGATPRDFNYAKSMWGMDDAFKGACAELLALTGDTEIDPIFDAILIDEAQDLPPEFFRLIYRFTKDPKRVVWAYDELQKLSEAAMPSTDELFGTTPTGDSLVTLSNTAGEARGDIVLPVCYRNSPWSLATAHAIGFGIYRREGLVQHFDDPELWEEIGYHVLTGSLTSGSAVELERAATSYPQYFPKLLRPDDAVSLHAFQDEVEQDTWVAQQIAANLTADELEADDILVVLPDAYTSKRRATRFARVLALHGIDSHLAGVSSSVDELFVRDSVAMAHIYRAKGNEAPMVYVVDSQYAINEPNQITRRNTLFTAITRSRAWVRICGWGDRMPTIAEEVERVKGTGYHLDFVIPTSEELARLRRIHRDRSDAEVASLKRATRNAKELLEAFERGEVELEDLPPAVRTRLARLIEADPSDDAD
jgi:superfamily I DNA and RNA helicase